MILGKDDDFVNSTVEVSMQNRYMGDIGDFGKLGLLRVLSSNGLSIGVNWYLTDDENHNGDGRHLGYLAKTEYRDCDEALWYALKRIVTSNQRETAAIENSASFQRHIIQFP